MSRSIAAPVLPVGASRMPSLPKPLPEIRPRYVSVELPLPPVWNVVWTSTSLIEVTLPSAPTSAVYVVLTSALSLTSIGWTVAALDGHGDVALAAQLARHGALLIGTGRGHVLEADINLCAGARHVSRQLVAGVLHDVLARHLHLRRGGGPEAAPISLDGLNIERHLAVSAALGERLCLARRSGRLSPRREGDVHQAIRAAPAERAFESFERLRIDVGDGIEHVRDLTDLHARRLRGRSQVRALDFFAAQPSAPVALEHRLASTLHDDGRGARRA